MATDAPRYSCSGVDLFMATDALGCPAPTRTHPQVTVPSTRAHAGVPACPVQQHRNSSDALAISQPRRIAIAVIRMFPGTAQSDDKQYSSTASSESKKQPLTSAELYYTVSLDDLQELWAADGDWFSLSGPVTGPIAHRSNDISSVVWGEESFDAVILDILFGKKFKITKDIQLLPDILQEMERVLRVGGTVVLLLSQDLHKHMDGITQCAENDSPNAISDGTSETAAAKALNVDGKSSSLVNGVEESFLRSRQTHFVSLVPDGVYGVSLGKTDAFIHKYRKISSAGNR
ncbi:THUMP domain-containing protein 2-like [Grus japonensis]|uniref:THUMP domain-containing protein 2-like n=1 Tax=Grus japonensis TaxID=30415 RepID=A0ABC9WQA6_GRUJA